MKSLTAKSVVNRVARAPPREWPVMSKSHSLNSPSTAARTSSLSRRLIELHASRKPAWTMGSPSCTFHVKKDDDGEWWEQVCACMVRASWKKQDRDRGRNRKEPTEKTKKIRITFILFTKISLELYCGKKSIGSLPSSNVHEICAEKERQTHTHTLSLGPFFCQGVCKICASTTKSPGEDVPRNATCNSKVRKVR